MSKWCAATKNGVQCGKPASVLDHKRTMRVLADGGYNTVYICLSCARHEYPDLFPLPPKQNELPNMPKRKWQFGKPREHMYVPLDAPLPGGSREA